MSKLAHIKGDQKQARQFTSAPFSKKVGSSLYLYQDEAACPSSLLCPGPWCCCTRTQRQRSHRAPAARRSPLPRQEGPSLS